MKRHFLLLLIAALCILAKADAPLVDTVMVDEVTSIYDGDTFRVNIKSWPKIIGERVPIRVRGVDTPELRGACQQEKELARKAKQFTVQTLREAKQIELRNLQRGKYFRIVADVWVDGHNLAQLLIARQLGKPYQGKKINFC